jgi:2'-5' RNA ligase
MANKTHKTAVALIPPPRLWEPIQAIRREHDRQLRRWIPHVTLVYPFRPQEEFGRFLPDLRAVCAGIPPFQLELSCFRHFHHGGERYTLWLDPRPAPRLDELQKALQQVAPDCDDQRRHPDGFTPHLSVGQVRGRRQLERLEEELSQDWQPLQFTVREVQLIARGDPPVDRFEIVHVVSLGSTENDAAG